MVIKQMKRQLFLAFAAMLALLLSSFLYAFPAFASDNSEPATSLKTATVAKADSSCVLLTKNNHVVPCTSEGVKLDDKLPGGTEKIKTLYISADVTSIKEKIKDGDQPLMWSDFQNLSKIVFLTKNGKNNCKHIESYAFFDACWRGDGFKVIGLENTCLKTIGQCAFQNSGLKGCIRFPSTLKSIGRWAFMSTNLSKVLGLEKTRLSKFSVMAFSETHVKTLTLPKTCSKITEAQYFAGYDKQRGVVKKNLAIYLTRQSSTKITSTGTLNPLAITLKPSAIKVMNPGPISRSLKITWKRVPKLTGYEVWLSPSKRFSKNIIKTTFSQNSSPAKKGKFNGLAPKNGKKYYAKIRTYLEVDTTEDGTVTFYSAWSKVKSGKSKR